MYNDEYSKIKYEYNEHNLLTEIAYYDTNDNLCLNKDGIARSTIKYTPDGQIKEITFRDTNDALRISKKLGYAKYAAEFNHNREISNRNFYGANNAPCDTHTGYCVVFQIYDDYGNPTQTIFQNSNGDIISYVPTP